MFTLLPNRISSAPRGLLIFVLNFIILSSFMSISVYGVWWALEGAGALDVRPMANESLAIGSSIVVFAGTLRSALQ